MFTCGTVFDLLSNLRLYPSTCANKIYTWPGNRYFWRGWIWCYTHVLSACVFSWETLMFSSNLSMYLKSGNSLSNSSLVHLSIPAVTFDKRFMSSYAMWATVGMWEAWSKQSRELCSQLLWTLHLSSRWKIQGVNKTYMTLKINFTTLSFLKYGEIWKYTAKTHP